MKVIFATNNQGKLKEVRNIFEGTNFEIVSLKDIGFTEEIEETGTTFEDNAFIKADTIFNKFNVPVIADDSGLAVDQLEGRPGVYSARFAGKNATYEDNNLKLLEELKDFSQPHKAQFLCCAVFVDQKNRISVLGKLPGEIMREFKGDNGFGFDPIFKPDNAELSLAQIRLEEKNKISHRAKAFNNLKEEINKII
jgi:XTP/dITP diphosphohydrolase